MHIDGGVGLRSVVGRRQQRTSSTGVTIAEPEPGLHFYLHYFELINHLCCVKSLLLPWSRFRPEFR